MKYFLDTEFLEAGPSKPLQLISLGIVSETEKQYYAQTNWFDVKLAGPFVWTHVFPQLQYCLHQGAFQPPVVEHEVQLHVNGKCHHSASCPWRTRIAMYQELIEFFQGDTHIEFWGWYSAYDTVLFCQLFGTLMLVPKQFPVHIHDLKTLHTLLGEPQLPTRPTHAHQALYDALWNKEVYDVLVQSHVETGKRSAVGKIKG